VLSIISIVAVGFVLGIRHATDPDHVIAIATIITRQHTIYRAALIGICWGIGHTLTIVSLGVAVIAFELVIPVRVGLSMELSVGVMLMVLGFINVRSFVTSMPKPIALPGGDVPAVIANAHEREGYFHSHSSAGAAGRGTLPWLDRTFAGLGIYVYVRPLMVGLVHGMAGSAAIALLALATIRDPRWALAYLLLFGIGTVAGMVLITVSMASALRVFGIGSGQRSRRFALVSGVLSMAFGCLVAFQILLLDGLLAGHPNWTPK
jgi:high-affinity nickel-transport protein